MYSLWMISLTAFREVTDAEFWEAEVTEGEPSAKEWICAWQDGVEAVFFTKHIKKTFFLKAFFFQKHFFSKVNRKCFFFSKSCLFFETDF